ncbi:MAG TPA: DUF952 domain-containing protein [Caulobacteraceae bacterium]|jgi:uncharacterized protein (DUF952 family)
MSRIYKILPRQAWEAAAAAGRFTGAGVDLADGYIHFSTAAQAPETAARYFAGQADLMVLEVESEALGPALRWEAARGGDLFPHLYAPLPTAAVLSARSAPLGADGVPILGALS